MDVTLKIDSPQKGRTFVTNIEGQIVTFQIVDIQTLPASSGQKTTTEMTKEELLNALEPDHEKLKGSILKDDDPFGPPVPEKDWEIYNS